MARNGISVIEATTKTYKTMSYREMDFVNGNLRAGSSGNNEGDGWDGDDGSISRSNSTTSGDYYSDMNPNSSEVDSPYAVGEEFKWFVIWMVMASILLILPFCCNSAYRSKLCFYLWRPCGRVALVNPSSEDTDEEGRQGNARIDTIFRAAVIRTDRRIRENQLKLDQAKAARVAAKRQLLEQFLQDFTINLAPPINVSVSYFPHSFELQGFDVSSLSPDNGSSHLARRHGNNNSITNSPGDRHEQLSSIEESSPLDTFASVKGEIDTSAPTILALSDHGSLEIVDSAISDVRVDNECEEDIGGDLSRDCQNNNDGRDKQVRLEKSDESQQITPLRQEKMELETKDGKEERTYHKPQQFSKEFLHSHIFFVPLPGMTKQEADHLRRMSEAHGSLVDQESYERANMLGAASLKIVHEAVDDSDGGSKDVPSQEACETKTRVQDAELRKKTNNANVKGEGEGKENHISNNEEHGTKNTESDNIHRPPMDHPRCDVGHSSMEGHSTSIFLRTVPTCCAICLDLYKEDDEVCWSPNVACSHVFHKQCIFDWLISRKSRRFSQQETPEEILHPTRSLEESVRDAPMTCPCCRHKFIDSSRPMQKGVTPVTTTLLSQMEGNEI